MAFYFASFQRVTLQRGERLTPALPIYESRNDYRRLEAGNNYRLGSRFGLLRRGSVIVNVLDEEMVKVRALNPTSIIIYKFESENFPCYIKFKLWAGESRKFERVAIHIDGNPEQRLIWHKNPQLHLLNDIKLPS